MILSIVSFIPYAYTKWQLCYMIMAWTIPLYNCNSEFFSSRNKWDFCLRHIFGWVSFSSNFNIINIFLSKQGANRPVCTHITFFSELPLYLINSFVTCKIIVLYLLFWKIIILVFRRTGHCFYHRSPEFIWPVKRGGLKMEVYYNTGLTKPRFFVSVYVTDAGITCTHFPTSTTSVWSHVTLSKYPTAALGVTSM